MIQFFLLIATLLFAGCDRQSQLPKDFAQALDTYYENEKKENWKSLYQSRRQEYRNYVPLDVFLREMDEYSSEFNLLSYEVVDAKVTDTEVFVTNNFKIRAHLTEDSVYSQVFQNKMSSDFIEKSIVSHWIKIDGKWVLLSSNRMFQPLSYRMVYDS